MARHRNRRRAHKDPNAGAKYIIDRKQFIATENGLTSGGQLFDSNADRRIPTPDRFGGIPDYAVKYRQSTKQYWKAQCGFRGLETSGSKMVLLKRVHQAYRDGHHEIMAELAPIEKDLQDAITRRVEAEKNAAEELIEQWSARSDDEKIATDLLRFLDEKFPVYDSHGITRTNVAVLKSFKLSELRLWFSSRQLSYGLVHSPARDASGQNERWLVVARHHNLVVDRVRQIRHERERLSGLQQAGTK
jgi:hypothetical protein